MLDACAPHARWIDVFCENGAFDGDQTRAILEAGIAKGLTPRVHANQLAHGPGVQIAVELNAASADHVTHVTDEDVDALANSRHRRHAAARRGVQHPRAVPRRAPPDRRGRHGRARRRLQPRLELHDQHPVLHRDRRARDAHDPRRGGLGGDRRAERERCGAPTSATSRPGARADAVLLEAPSHIHLAYRPGVPLVSAVWRGGSARSSTARDAPPYARQQRDVRPHRRLLDELEPGAVPERHRTGASRSARPRRSGRRTAPAPACSPERRASQTIPSASGAASCSAAAQSAVQA